MLLAHTVAYASDASLTDSIWYHPEFSKPEHEFSVKPGIILRSWIHDGHILVDLARVRQLSPSSSSIFGMHISAKDQFIGSLNFYLFPRVITLTQLSLHACGLTSRAGISPNMFTETKHHGRRAGSHSHTYGRPFTNLV